MSRIVTRTIERHAAVHDQLRHGRSVSAIAQVLGLDRKTVRKFARAATPDDVLTLAGKRTSKLDPFKAYLNNRLAEGCENAAVLTEEVKAQGFRGSDKTVRRYLHPLRDTTTPPPPPPPSVREVTRWILTHPDHLDPADKTKLDTILARSTPLCTTAARVAEFAEMMTGLRGQRLHDWMTAIDTDDNLPDLKSFTAGIRRDMRAVLNGLTLPYNSGAVEGTVNKLKFIKRQMFGRAKFDLLRKRVLLA
ncbi:transposase [Actinopolymorpha sp. B17G11]|uniref:transposase n=1 Tax=Actinopolymorpha sp. B17G11 TaxID=3160861 RepID=UPI0032E51746